MMIVNKKIGDMTENELKDFIIELQKENSRYERINQKYKEVIDEAIKLIEDGYYSKNTTDIDSIVISGDKLLQVRKILKRGGIK